MKNSYVSLFVWAAVTLGAGTIGGMVSRPDAWYYALNKPLWTPPDWIFAPVWILLYLVMGIAAWLIWERCALRPVYIALILYVIQLTLNAAWPWLFFGLRYPGLAFAEICLLWTAVAATSLAFWRIYRPAAVLMFPYLLWVTFAAALNFSIWQQNMRIS